MTILDEINNRKYQEVAQNKVLNPVAQLEKSPLFERDTYSFSEFICRPDKTGIISEFKRKSPSKGLINGTATVEAVTTGYAQAGVSALSVLTDTDYFGGANADLTAARRVNQIPILRKDFIIDEYQIIEAKAIGADVILLIAASLTKQRAKELAAFARSLKLEVLMEVHTQEELDLVNEHLNVVGVNNRDLKTFKVDIQTSVKLSELIPSDFVKISESGLSSGAEIRTLKAAGFQGFLIGESFMKTQNPAKACAEFLATI